MNVDNFFFVRLEEIVEGMRIVDRENKDFYIEALVALVGWYKKKKRKKK